MTDSQGLLDKLTGNMFGGESAPDTTPTPTPPPGAQSARPSTAEFVPPASSDSTTSEDGLPELTLAQTVELVAPTEPEPSEAPTEPAAETDPATPAMSERELQLQAQLDQLQAEKAEREAQAEEQRFEQAWAETWDNGYAKFDAMASAKAVEMQNEGRSQEEIDSYVLRNILPLQQKWEAQVAANERAALKERERSRFAPNQIDTLITQYGLSPEDKATLQKYAKHPEILKSVAADLGARVAKTQMRDQAVTLAARDSAAADLQKGFEPGTPQSASYKPYRFKGGAAKEEEGAAVAGLLFQRAQRKFAKSGTQ